MKQSNPLGAVLVALTLFSATLIAQAETYKIDPVHSEVSFKIRHLGISKVKGTFSQFEGAFSFDPGQVADSVVSATIDIGTIDTANEDRDKHLLSADFFDVEKFPKMTFQSTKTIPGDTPDEFTVMGNLTLHGVTKEIELKVESGGQVTDPWGNQRAGFTAEATIDRQDFGLAFSKTLETGQLLVGNEVWITLEIEGIQEK